MVYTYKKCPPCGKTYENYNNATKSMTVSDGCPIVTCKFCHKEFIDNDIKEPVFVGDEPSRASIFGIIISPLYLIGLPLFLSYGIAIKYKSFFATIIAIVFSIAYLWFVYKGIKVKKEINEDFIKEYEESKKRCSNREYIVFLINSGYKIPEHFLEANYPDLIDYQRKYRKQ